MYTTHWRLSYQCAAWIAGSDPCRAPDENEFYRILVVIDPFWWKESRSVYMNNCSRLVAKDHAFVNYHWRLYQNCILCCRMLSQPSKTARRCMLQRNRLRWNTAVDLPRYSPNCRLCMLSRNNLLRFCLWDQKLILYHYSSCCCCCSCSSFCWGNPFRNA